MRDVLISGLILAGAGLVLTGAIGLVRLPDVLCRSHAVAKALTLGIFLLLFALWAEIGETAVAFKILLAIFFQAMTIPVAGHLISRLAFRQNVPRWRHRPMDDPRRRGGQPEGGA
jgi:multicomponent Na+:H+ antiporter subunit G